MHRPTLRLLAALATLVLVLAAACDGEGGAGPVPTTGAPPVPVIVAEGQPIVVGVSAALAGDQAAIGGDIADAALLAIRDYGDIRGRRVELAREDDGCADAERASAAARALVARTGLVAVVGPMCTTGAQAAGKLYEAAGIVHITPSASRDELSQQGERFFFRTAWRDDAQAQVQARYAREQVRAASAVVVDDGQPYGKALADTFGTTFESLGGSVLGRERIAPGTTDFAGLARQLRSAAPDVIVFEGRNPEGALLVRALRGAAFSGIFIGPDALVSARDFIVPPDPAAAESAVLTGPPAPDETFLAKFGEAQQRPPSTPFVLQSYDAMTALLKAIDAAARDGEDGAIVIERAALAQAVRDQQFDGLTGGVAFDERGDRRGERARDLGLRIYRVEGGAFVPVE